MTFGQVSTLRIAATVNEHWRGAYDILVTPNDSVSRSADATSGLIEPDYISYVGSGGISVGQWHDIAAMPDVGVAAPLGFLGYVTSDPNRPVAYIAHRCLPAAPTIFRLDLTVATSDGSTSIAVSRQSMDILVGPTGSDGQSKNYRTSTGSDIVADPDGVAITFPDALPAERNGMIAVDPKAERALLHQPAAFLGPLRIPDGQLSAATFPLGRIPPDFPESKVQLGADQAHNPDPVGDDPHSVPAIPIMVGSTLGYPLTAVMTVSRVGTPFRSYPSVGDGSALRALERARKTQTLTRVGTRAVDLAAGTRAFEAHAETLAWPGCPSAQYGAGRLSDHENRDAGRASYTPTTAAAGDETFRVAPTGLVDAGGLPKADGGFESYRRLETSHRRPPMTPKPSGNVPPNTPFVFAPVGTFDNADLRLPSDPLSHAPLGAYEPASGVLLPSPTATSGTRIGPTSNPVGLLTGPPDVITSIAGAVRLAGSRPIDAIRVRVSDVTSYSASSEARVEAVAARIAQLGLTVHIVAGSSPQHVVVLAAGYPAGGTKTAAVVQLWTTLGVAQHDVAVLSSGERRLLILALILVALLAIGMVITDASAKAPNTRVWRALGWTVRRQVWWLIGDTAVALALASAAVAAAANANGRPWAAVVAFMCAFVVAGIQGLWSALTVTRAAGPRRIRRRTALLFRATTVTYSVRVLSRDAVLSLGTALGLAVGSLGCIVAIGSIERSRSNVGTSLLSGALNKQLIWTHGALLAVLVIGSAAVSGSLQRLQTRRRVDEFRALSALGWSARRLLAQLRVETLFSVVVALGVASVGCAVFGVFGAPIWAVIGVLAGIAAVTTAIASAAARRAVYRVVET